MSSSTERQARHRPLWHVVLGFFLFMVAVNVGLHVLDPQHRYFELKEDRRLPVSRILIANGDLRLAGWLNPAGHASQPPTLVGSYHRLVERVRDGAEEDLPLIGVAVVVDPRTLASDCIRLEKGRQACLAEALEYFEALSILLDAPMHPVVPVPMAPEGSPRSEVLTSHHTVSCWLGQEGREPPETVNDITAAGGRCVLLLDALDVHAYPDYSNTVLDWFVGEEEAVITEEIVEVDSPAAEGEQEAARGVLRLLGRHQFYLTSMDGRWGDFNDVLTRKEVEEVENYSRDWLVQNDLSVEAEDIFFVFIMYAEDKLNLWKHNIEAMALSLQQNGGELKKGSGALLVYTPHGEKRPNLDVLTPLLEANNIEIVFMPTPWQEDMSKAWTLHFLKTDVASYAPAWERKIVMFMDLDMLILGDIVPFVSPRHLRMTPATTVVTVESAAWRRHGFQSEGDRTMHHFGTMEAAYYNSGVMIAPAKIFAAFLRQTEREAEIELKADRHDLLGRDQVMFEFAHYTLDPPFLELPHDLNLDSALAQNLACQVLNTPLIYHYHRNPLFSGVPPSPVNACPAYGKLRKSLATLKESYRTASVLNG